MTRDPRSSTPYADHDGWDAARSERVWIRRTILLIAAVTLARVAFLAWGSIYTLIEDEAHYWEWSRRLDWSYYTKGPGVAWVIALSTKLLGTSEFAIRLPAAISAGIATLAIAGLARDVSRSARVAFYAAACFTLIPLLQVTGLIMTIDGPYAACWSLAMWAGWRALGEDRPGYLPAVGLMLGIGVLFKYTILLALPGLVWFAWATRGKRRRPMAWACFIGLALFCTGLLPIVIWNARNGWPTLAHLLGHLGVKGGDVIVTQGSGRWHYNPKWTLEYIGTQLALVGPALAFMAAYAVSALKRSTPSERRPAEWFLLANAFPMLAFYLGVSFFTRPEGNWPLAGYLTLIPLAAWRIAEDHSPASRHLWRATVIVGMVVAACLTRMDLLARLPLIGRAVPIHRFTGADDLAEQTRLLMDELRAETGREPFVMAMHYGRVSQLAFYLPGRPTVYCSSSLMLGGRHVQYDYWPDTDLRRNRQLIGRPAIMFGGTMEDWAPVFQYVIEVGLLPGEGKKDRPAMMGYGFRGFPPGGIPFDPESFTRR